MLKIKDKEGKLKFVLRDEDEEPLSIDEFILEDAIKSKKKNKENEDAGSDEC